MKYLVLFYTKGSKTQSKYTAAKSFLGAMNKTSRGAWWNWNHALVVNENHMGKRYLMKDGNLKVLKGEVKAFPSGDTNMLLLIDKYAEIHKFDTQEERDSAIKQCTTSSPAASAANDREPNDTTASFDATSGSRSGSTSKKTSNGFATSVTWMAGLTHFSTAASSGFDSARDSEEEEWSGGSTPSRSKRHPTFATVKQLPEFSAYPGVNTYMQALTGKTIKVKPYKVDGKKHWHGGGWAWLEEWLDFENIEAVLKFKNTGEGSSIYYTRSHGKLAGKKVKWEVCNDHWTHGGICVVERWLRLASDEKEIVRGVFLGNVVPAGITFLSGMQKHVGKVCHFQKSTSHTYKLLEGNWYVPESWIKFDSEKFNHDWKYYATLPSGKMSGKSKIGIFTGGS